MLLNALAGGGFREVIFGQRQFTLSRELESAPPVQRGDASHFPMTNHNI